MDKKELRKQLKAQRNGFSVEKVARASELVCQQILGSESYKKAETILGYLAFGKELNIDKVLQQALRAGKKVYVPHIISAIEFDAVELQGFTDFLYDRYGIRSVAEPKPLQDLAELDLVLVPAVAFARDGNRLGMGAGYYDRFLHKCPQAFKLGVAYEELLQEQLPTDEYDIAVDMLVTESELLTINKKE